MTRSIGVALALAVITCASSGAPSAPAPGHGTQGNADSGAGHKVGPMASPFKEALQRFQREVAATFGKRTGDLKIMPPSEDFPMFPQSIAGLIAFQADAGELQVRGLANKTTVVLAKRNDYGALFQAARAADPAASSAANDVASRIVWLMGREFRLVSELVNYPKYPLPSQVTLPQLERGPQGMVLRFYYLDGRDAHMGAPPLAFRAEIRCSPDYKSAALITSPGP
jgi:hypothetical protein